MAEEAERLKQQIDQLEAERKASSLTDASKAYAQQQVKEAQSALEATQLELAQLKVQACREREELEHLRAGAENLQSAADKAKAEMHKQTLEFAKKEAAFHAKISETRQVKQLMDMLQQKSQEVGILRKQLAAQGQETIADADA